MKNNSLKILEEFYRKNTKEILDIIIFGSTIRGKKNPSDLDVLIIYKDKENEDTTYELQKKLEKEINSVDVVSKKYVDIFDENFVAKESILKEGYSVLNKALLSKKLNYSSFILFKYKLDKLTKSKKMNFYYSLYGRNGCKGMLDKLGLIKFSESTLLCPIENVEETKAYLNQQYVEYDEVPLLIPTRIILVNA